MKFNIHLLKRNFLWILFIGFAIFAIYTREDKYLFTSQGSYSFGKYIAWIIFLCFFLYSIYSSAKENFFKSVIRIGELFWGWQIGIDLYIGLFFSLLIIYLHGGVLIFLVWLIPVLIYANLATLLYFALNYDSLISHFII